MRCLRIATADGAATGDCSGGHIYNWYPVGVPLMAAPVVLGIRAALSVASPALAGLGTSGRRPILDAFLRGGLVGGRAAVEMIAASWIVALAAAVLFLTARRFLPARPAAALALLFAFATPACSTTSRALPAFAACAAAVLGAFAAYNLSAFGSWLPSYYRLRPPAPGWGIWEVLAGNLVSPSRGLLVFTPVFLFSLAVRRPQSAALAPAAAGVPGRLDRNTPSGGVALRLLLVGRL
jgi:hypothetical protein